MTTYIDFRPDGPHAFGTHVYLNNKSRTLDEKAFKKWVAALAASSSRGVYIVALGNKTARPWYVGKTHAGTFASECTTPHTVGKINRAIQSSKGTPLLYFLEDMTETAAATKGIDALETEMIRWCFSLNPRLLNEKKKLPQIETFVRGVLRSGKGKPSTHALRLRDLLRV